MAQQKAYQEEEQKVPAVLVAGSRLTDRYEECGKVFGQLGRKVGRFINGIPLCLMYDDEYREEDATFGHPNERITTYLIVTLPTVWH